MNFPRFKIFCCILFDLMKCAQSDDFMERAVMNLRECGMCDFDIDYFCKTDGTFLCLSSLRNIDNIAFENFPFAETLYMKSNELKSIPEGIRKMSNLKRLYIRSNEISEIPEWIGKLTSLEYLNLSDNNISEIPCDLSELVNLKSLDLSTNLIEEIPEEIVDLLGLDNLNLSNNDISEIPE